MKAIDALLTFCQYVIVAVTAVLVAVITIVLVFGPPMTASTVSGYPAYPAYPVEPTDEGYPVEGYPVEPIPEQTEGNTAAYPVKSAPGYPVATGDNPAEVSKPTPEPTQAPPVHSWSPEPVIVMPKPPWWVVLFGDLLPEMK